MDIPPIAPVSSRPLPLPATPPDTPAQTTPQAEAAEVDGTPAPLAGVHPSMQRDERTGVDVVQFRDNETGEVVSQLPTKAVLALITASQTNRKGGQLR